MEFDNNKSIYLQIAENIRERIVGGVYPAGEKIPSVRELSAEMGVNPNTIMRTYTELQTMEIIDNKRGIGYFVRPEAPQLIIEGKKKHFFEKVFPEFIRQAGLLGITAGQLKTHIDQLHDVKNNA
jgi:GntR family transcriptional regulator